MFHLCEVSTLVKSIETKQKEGFQELWGEGGMGCCCWKGVKFQLRKINSRTCCTTPCLRLTILVNMKRSSYRGAAETNLTRIHEVGGSIPGLAQWLRLWCCHELWCRSQTRLRSGIAVAVVQASSYISTQTPSLETTICHRSGPKKTKQTNKTRKLYSVPKFIFESQKLVKEFPLRLSGLRI